MEQDIAHYSDGWRIDQIRKKAQEAGRFLESKRTSNMRAAYNELVDIIVIASVAMQVIKNRLDYDAFDRRAR
jgi:hypothetical protein